MNVSPALYEVLYVSTLAPEQPLSVVAEIAGRARQVNAELDVTGLLIFDGQRFPGNPTRSYRTRAPLRMVAEVKGWIGHTPEQLTTMRERLAELDRQGVEAIED